MAVRLSRIEEQVVYRVGGAQGSSTLVGTGFVYDKDGIEHGEKLEACILKADGSACEDNDKIEIVQPGKEDKNNTNFIIKVTVKNPKDPKKPYPDDFYGKRKVVIKKEKEMLVKDKKDGLYKCPYNSTTCSILEDAIEIKRAYD